MPVRNTLRPLPNIRFFCSSPRATEIEEKRKTERETQRHAHRDREERSHSERQSPLPLLPLQESLRENLQQMPLVIRAVATASRKSGRVGNVSI